MFKETLVAFGTIGILAWLSHDSKTSVPVQQSYFPTRIGYDPEMHTFDMPYIHSAFRNFDKQYKHWFLQDIFYKTPNMITYCFGVYEPLNKVSPRRMLDFAMHVAEGALADYLHEAGIYNVKVQNLIAVTQKMDKLYVHIAITNMGIKEVQQLKTPH